MPASSTRLQVQRNVSIIAHFQPTIVDATICYKCLTPESHADTESKDPRTDWVFRTPYEKWDIDCVKPYERGPGVKSMVWGCLWGNAKGILVPIVVKSFNSRAVRPSGVTADEGDPSERPGSAEQCSST